MKPPRVLAPGETSETLIATVLAIVYDDPPPSCDHGAPSCHACRRTYAQRLLREWKARNHMLPDAGKES